MFYELTRSAVLTEGEYNSLWKAYIFSVAGNYLLEEIGLSLWIAFDRLDEAFQGAPDHEVPALRALLRVYLDLGHLHRVKLKLFIRNDLFGRITAGGFVNLTHVNARRLVLSWEPPDLLDLLARRLVDNSELMERLGIDPAHVDSEAEQEDLLRQIFPEQVDAGAGRPTTWNWILSRIRDGQDVRPPRNLIDLVEFTRLSQLRADEREKKEWTDPPLIEGESIKHGLRRLSAARVEDTLEAEYPNLQMYFELFRDGKAEQNRESLAALIGGTNGELQSAIDRLVACGFLERIGDSWKVPMLYRDGLKITQGKAFAAGPGEDPAPDEE